MGYSKQQREQYLIHFLDTIKQIHPQIQIIGEYVNAHTNIDCKCLQCGYEWKPKPHNLLKGHGCPKCAGRERLTLQTFKNKLHKINTDIILESDYINQTTYITVKCNVCNYKWVVKPYSLLNGHGCPKCKGIKTSLLKTKTHQQFLDEIKQINPFVKILETYINNDTKILCECLQCHKNWKVTPHSLLSGHGCPHCKYSLGEQKVSQYLTQHNISFVPQYTHPQCKYHKLLRFDFALIDNNEQVYALIEYDGKQHFEEVDFSGNGDADENLWRVQKYDSIKDEFCKRHNIPLLRIPYWEYDRVELLLEKFIFTIGEW